jgi:signal transduction histidine kinase
MQMPSNFTDDLQLENAPYDARLLRVYERMCYTSQAIEHACPHGQMIFDQTGTLISLNPHAAQLLGMPDPDAPAPRLLLCADDAGATPLRPFALGEFCELSTQVSATPVALTLYRCDELQPRCLHASLTPIITETGDRLGFVVALSDVTSLHDLYRHMQHLLYTVSHDLRNPLAILSGHVQVLCDAAETSGLDANVGHSLAAITRATQRLQVLIGDLTDEMYLKTGRLTLCCQPVDVAALCADVLAAYAALLPPARVACRIAPGLPVAQADPARLERILLNLLTNALKYTDGPVELAVSAEQEAVVVAVSDAGGGLPPDVLARMFRPETAVRGAHYPGGTGLGLSIVRTLIEAHGGRLQVDTTDHGTTFTITLPTAQACCLATLSGAGA